MGEDALPETGLLYKAATVKTLQYLSLGCDLKKQTDIVKDQYMLFKDQINVINNNIEGDVKTENGTKSEDGVKTNIYEITDDVEYFYIGDEYKNLIG